MKKSAFTLMELSMVLVIIGLIVGGILTGKDLIRAAEIRATIGQYEKFNTSVNTFKIKYGGLPGDLLSTQALAFGLYCIGGTPTTCTGGSGRGDNNGLITGNSLVISQGAGETLLFWRHLADANLIDGSYNYINQSNAFGTSTNMYDLFPSAKMERGLYWMVGSNSGINYYLLTTGSLPLVNQDVSTTASGGMTPNEAYSIDSKLDDGMPNSGGIQARGTTTGGPSLLFPALVGGGTANHGVNHLAGAEAAGDCTVTPASLGVATPLSPFNNYSVGSVAGNTKACGLRLKFQ